MVVSNRIDGPALTPTLSTERTQAPASTDAASDSKRAEAVRGTDAAAFTKDALQLQQLSERVSAGESVDHERVAAVKKAIADGNFSVDAERVAAKMSTLEQALSGGR